MQRFGEQRHTARCMCVRTKPLHAVQNVGLAGESDCTNREVRRDVGKAAGVILMDVREHREIDAADALSGQKVTGRNTVREPLEFLRQRASAVNQQGERTLLDQDGIAIPHIDERNLQSQRLLPAVRWFVERSDEHRSG